MSNETLANRYQLTALLGEGGSGKTYRGLDLEHEQEVAIKLLSLRRAQDWKAIELCQREAKTLAQLDHPAIPKYLDFFQIDWEGEQTLAIIQALAPGKTLETWVTEGYYFTEQETQQIAMQILEILQYLQSFVPPIIHRDIKPQNLLRTNSGMIYLVDFGAVRDTYHLTITGGSTIVGTYGYMAPEQFRGQAVLATDLYGLGATLIYLLTHQDPADLPQKQMQLDFHAYVQISPNFTAWLDNMLQPIPEDRFATAATALLAMHRDAQQLLKPRRPKHPIARLTHDGDGLTIFIPPLWLATQRSKKIGMGIITLSLINLFCIWLLLAATLPTVAMIVIATLLLPLLPWTIYLLGGYLQAIATGCRLQISSNAVHINCCIGKFSFKKAVFERRLLRISATTTTDALLQAGGIHLHGDGNKEYRCLDITIGRFLDKAEQVWLFQEIENKLIS